MIQAVTNRQIGLKFVPTLFYVRASIINQSISSVITELIIGFMIPGIICFVPIIVCEF
jgi:hypothetical protein